MAVRSDMMCAGATPDCRSSRLSGFSAGCWAGNGDVVRPKRLCAEKLSKPAVGETHVENLPCSYSVRDHGRVHGACIRTGSARSGGRIDLRCCPARRIDRRLAAEFAVCVSLECDGTQLHLQGHDRPDSVSMSELPAGGDCSGASSRRPRTSDMACCEERMSAPAATPRLVLVWVPTFSSVDPIARFRCSRCRSKASSVSISRWAWRV